jgi:subfamily B ATP-binding cassette protein HlyB/CyaB
MLNRYFILIYDLLYHGHRTVSAWGIGVADIVTEARSLIRYRGPLGGIAALAAVLFHKINCTGEGAYKFAFATLAQTVERHRRVLAGIVTASVLLQVLVIAVPVAGAVVIDRVSTQGGVSMLEVMFVGLAAIVMAEHLLGGLRSHLASRLASYIEIDLGKQLFVRLTALPLAYFQARPAGEFLARFGALHTIALSLAASVLPLAIDIVFAVLVLLGLTILSPLLCLVAAAAIPLYLALLAIPGPLLVRRLQERFTRGAERQSHLVAAAATIESVKAMAMERLLQRRWHEQLAGHVFASQGVSRLASWSTEIARGLRKLTMVGVLFVGGRMVLAHDMTIGELVAFTILTGHIHSVLLRLVRIWPDLREAQIAVVQLGTIVGAHAETSHPLGRAAAPIQGSIAFERVCFRYGPERGEILTDMNLTVSAGEIIGILGPSGSGKSTLARLMQRFYLPEHGRILIDGMDLSLMDPVWLRRQIGVVPQDVTLFGGTIRENIAGPDPALGLDKVIAAAKRAGAHDFIIRLPQGYDTRLEEGGVTLSASERRRIAIARALISEPGILILDDTTTVLDEATEAVIQNTINAMAGRTVIILAQRLSALAAVDRVLIMDHGRLTPVGDWARRDAGADAAHRQDDQGEGA